MFCVDGASIYQQVAQDDPAPPVVAPAVNNKPSRSAQRKKSNRNYRAARRQRKEEAAQLAAAQQAAQLAAAQQQAAQQAAQQQAAELQAAAQPDPAPHEANFNVYRLGQFAGGDLGKET